jgi:DNA transposition AAA+ family ATPase
MGTPAPSQLKVSATATHDEELRQWLENHMNTHKHLTANELSRSTHIGKSASTIKAYVAGKYFLPKEQGGQNTNPAKLEGLIRAYRDRIEGVVKEGYSTSFVTGRAWSQFSAACRKAIDERTIVVVYGPPGVGKSRCKLEYLTANATMPIDVLCSAVITTRHLVQKIAKQLGLNETEPTSQLTDKIAEKLRKNLRPVFVDQANYLNEQGLGVLCHLWEVAKVPIIMIGTKDLYELFTSSRMIQDVRAQLSSRVALHCELFTLSLSEFKTIVISSFDDESKALLKELFGINGVDHAVSHLFKICGGHFETEEGGGANHRHLEMVAPSFVNSLNKNSQILRNVEGQQRDLAFREMILMIAAKIFVG